MTKSPEFKRCNRCGIVKHEESFAKNQYRKNNVIVRRAYCKDCGKKIKPISTKLRKAYVEKNPKPEMGVDFKCPVCTRITTPWHKNQICLDHNHETGEIRGWLCGDCNASMGRLGDNVTTLERAIKWIKGELKNY
jgi:hypothetical protein